MTSSKIAVINETFQHFHSINDEYSERVTGSQCSFFLDNIKALVTHFLNSADMKILQI